MKLDVLRQIQSQTRLINWVFYFFIWLLIAVTFSYLLFFLKVYTHEQALGDINNQIALYATDEQKALEREILDYKKKVDDFAVIINAHRISSNVFNFIEQNTLPRIWFSSFDMSETGNQVRVVGQADTLETMSRQVKIFEESKQYVERVATLNTQIELDGKVGFTLNVSLKPELFAANTLLTSP